MAPAKTSASPAVSCLTSSSFRYRFLIVFRSTFLLWGTMMTTMMCSLLLTAQAHEVIEESSSSVNHVAEKEEDEDSEEEEETTTVSASVTLLVLLLIALTIAFEEGKEYMIEISDKDTKPIIDSLFGEMTVLGFLSLLTFCISKTGILPQISVSMFGQGEEDELLELFEFVHYMLFFVMIFFVITVLVLVRGAKNMEDYWHLLDTAARDEQYMSNAVRSHIANTTTAPAAGGTTRNHEEEEQAGFFNWWRSRFFSCQNCQIRPKMTIGVQDLILFAGIRKEFILERSPDPPYQPKENRVSDQFNFGRYLSVNFGHVLSHVVEVDIVTWMFFGCCSIICFFVLRFVTDQRHDLAWILVILGWLYLIFRNVFEYHILTILRAMSRPLATHDGTTTSEDHAMEHTERGGGVSSASSAPPPPPPPTTTTTTSSTPLLKDKKAVAKYDGVAATLSPKYSEAFRRQEDLYWRGRKGPKTYRILFQIQIVFTSAYISILCMAYLPFMYVETDTSEFSLYLILSILPIFSLMSGLRTAVANVSIVSCIGVHRHPQCVSQVIREEKTDRLIVAMIVMQKLHAAAIEGFADHHEHHAPTTNANLHSNELDFATRTFEALDHDSSGFIETKDLKHLMEALNIPVTDNALENMISCLDTDKNGRITENEFIDFYKKHILSAMDDIDNLDEVARQLFELFDANRSGYITLGEFKDVIDSFNVGFTVDEIGNLVNELDEDQSGTISIGEFSHLLKKHKYSIFSKKQSLPAVRWN